MADSVFAVLGGSRGNGPCAPLRVNIAEVAARTGRVALGADSSREGKLGQVAVPIRDQGTVSRVAVFSAPMDEIQGNVALQTARGFTPHFARLVRNNGSADQIDNFVSTISDRTNARVTLLAVRDKSNGPQLAIISDSDTDTRSTNLDIKAAEFVARTGRIAVGLDSSQPERSQIALPIRDDGAISHVVVFKGQA